MGYIIGLDIGGMSYKIGLVNEGKLIDRISYKVNKDLNQETQVREIGNSILIVIKRNGLNPSNIKGIGVGSPGVINSTKGYCDYASNLGWTKLDVCSILKSVTGIDTKITNDANAAALGEAKYGVGKNYSDSILITLGTGIGGGVVIQGKLFEGNEGKGTEIGHMSINTKGKKCACGRIGCLEAYASAKALEEQTVEAMLKHPESKLWELANGDVHNVTGKTPFDGYELNDPTAKKVIKKYLVYLGEGILNYCNIFRPNIIILGGGLSGNKLLLPLLTSYCKKRHYGFLNTPKVEIKTASLGNDAGIIGAASLFD